MVVVRARFALTLAFTLAPDITLALPAQLRAHEPHAFVQTQHVSFKIPTTAEQHTAAVTLVETTNSEGLVSQPRKVATVELAMKALEVPGDFVEAGVFNGGTAILMGKVMLPGTPQGEGRKLWLADSFQGLPEEHTRMDHNGGHRNGKIGGLAPASARQGHKGEYAIGRKYLDDNLKANHMTEDHKHIEVLEGWFKDTLPRANISQIAFLRLDGDIYASTWDALTALYDKVVPGGYIYADDYGAYEGCRQAIDDFREQRGIIDELGAVLEHPSAASYEAVWWRKGPASAGAPKTAVFLSK